MSFCRFPEDIPLYQAVRDQGEDLLDGYAALAAGLGCAGAWKAAPPPHGGSCGAGFPSDISCAERLLFSPPDIPSRPFLLALQLEPVGDHGDELRIGRLSLGGVYRIAEILLQRLDVAPVSCHLDGVTDGPFHPGWGSTEPFGYLRIQYLCHSVDHIHVIHRDHDGLP